MKSDIYIYLNLYLSFIYLNLDLAVEVFIIHINKDTFSPKMNSVYLCILEFLGCFFLSFFFLLNALLLYNFKVVYPVP